MNKWLVVHSLESYGQNPELVRFPAKTELDGSITKDKKGNPIPALKAITEVKPGNRIVYYCKGDSVIKGIFEIVEPVFAKEKQWPDSPFQFKIKPEITVDEPLNFKLLVSSLDSFKHLGKKWGMSLQGKYNALKKLSDHDFEIIEKALIRSVREAKEEKKEEIPKRLKGLEREHLRLQLKVADWGVKNGYRVHIAINDKNKIKKELPQILEEIPHFHHEDILDIAKRIDILFFDKERDILTHAFEVEITPIIYSGLLRLNDISERYPSEHVRYFIISHENNKDKFYRELERPSFYQLRTTVNS